MTDVFTQPSRDPLADVAVFLDEAVDALTFECGVSIDIATGEEKVLEPLELCASEELERMDRAMRADRDTPTLLDFYAKEWKRALVAIVSAQNALKAVRP
ncbi:hypothetical protein ICN83_18315 [Sphingopyxis granuli]|nr:hypothetical protein ICN83_18315 [Sphingopyxis granuli]